MNGRYGAIRYGSAVVNWYKFSRSRYRGSYGPVPIYPGWFWDDTHNAYSHRGLIGSWEDAAVMTTHGFVSYNHGRKPYDFVRV